MSTPTNDDENAESKSNEGAIDSAVSSNEASDDAVSSIEASDDVVSSNEAIDSAVSSNEASDDAASSNEASDDAVSSSVASDDVASSNEASDSAVSSNEAAREPEPGSAGFQPASTPPGAQSSQLGTDKPSAPSDTSSDAKISRAVFLKTLAGCTVAAVSGKLLYDSFNSSPKFAPFFVFRNLNWRTTKPARC